LSPNAAKTLRHKLAQWFQQNGRSLPWRDSPTPYAVLVSEFMLQQTQVLSVIPYFQRWMEKFPTLASLAAASEDQVLLLWQGLGYYSRARNLHRAAQKVIADFGGEIPSDPALLATLPGVGPYSAGAISAYGFDRPSAAVDANIARVLARLSNQQTPVDTPEGTRLLWKLAESLLPPEAGGRLHTSALMELGALVCVPKNPQCLLCPVSDACKAAAPETLPRKAQRRTTVALDENASWVVANACVLLEQQKGRRSGGMWKLPAVSAPPEDQPLFKTTYPFTHHKITLRVHPAAPPSLLAENQRWFALETVLDEAALPAGHRRALLALLASNS
jgi:A/G-specific adenine glycosylase